MKRLVVTGWARARSVFGRRTIGGDATAGLVLGVESVPDGLASGLLAGVNPLAGLYGYMYGMAGAALVTSTPFMAVQATGAMALIVGDVDLASFDDPGRSLFTLAILTGVVMAVAGFLRGGALLRFVPGSVMVGFISAVGLNIILGQLENFTGYSSDASNRVLRTFDLVLHLGKIDLASVAVGVVTLILILVLQRTRLRALGMVVAIAVGSLMAALLDQGVPLVRDLSKIPGSLPGPVLPAFGEIPFLLLPALSLGFVGLVQGAGVSAGFPRPDGRAADPSRDFIGQGAGNIVAGIFQGMPVGGSMSASALVVAGGARTRLALVIASVVMGAVILLLSDVVGLVAMPSLAALLMVVGYGAIKPAQIVAAARTGPVQLAVMATTFVLTMLIPLQYAVLVGVAMAVVLHVVQQSNRLVVTRVVPTDDGRFREEGPPDTVPPREVVILQVRGSLFFASAPVFERQLPDVDARTERAVVVLRLRGVDRFSLGFVEAFERLDAKLSATSSKLVLVVGSMDAKDQLDRLGVTKRIGGSNVYVGNEWIGETVRRAAEDAGRWVADT